MSRLDAVHEDPPPHCADKAAEPGSDLSADRRAALARGALAFTPDNAHRIPLRYREVGVPVVGP
jgi:hypothetical protein